MKLIIVGKATEIEYIGEQEHQVETGMDLDSIQPGITSVLPRELTIKFAMELDSTIDCDKYADIQEGLVYNKIKDMTGYAVDSCKFETLSAGFWEDPTTDYYQRADMQKLSETQYRLELTLQKNSTKHLYLGNEEAYYLSLSLEAIAEMLKGKKISVMLPTVYEYGDSVIFCAFTSDEIDIEPMDVVTMFLSLAARKFKLSEDDIKNGNIPKWYLNYCFMQGQLDKYDYFFEPCSFVQI